jgi:hypothetical protein
MMKSYAIRVLLAVLVTAAAGAASAQMVDQVESGGISKEPTLTVKPAADLFSLLDLSKVSWSHSYSVSFFSGGAMSGSVGLLSSTMLYEFSPSLSLTLNLGLAHSGGQWGRSRDAAILPGFTLDYHPSDKFRFTFQIQRYDAVLNPLTSRSSTWYSPVGPR